jgi:hypothetical protein
MGSRPGTADQFRKLFRHAHWPSLNNFHPQPQIYLAQILTEIKSNMNKHLKSSCMLGALLLALNASSTHAQLTSIDCGAISTNAGSKLLFVNGTNLAPASGFVQPLIFQRVANRYGTNAYYATSNLVFTALSAKTNTAGAAIGSYLVCEVVSVAGPAGATLFFWEQGNGRPNYAFPVGGTYAPEKRRFILSNLENGAGRPDGDPFGSIRGRRWVVDKAGDYDVTYRLIDTSVNHPTLAKTAIHAPSDPLTIKFSSGVDIGITQFASTNGNSTLVYKNGALTNLYVEASANLTNWTPVVGPFASLQASLLTTNVFTNTVENRFYRLRGTSPL